MIKLALIGYGYWGPNLLRNFEKLNNCKISYLIDTNTQKLDIIVNDVMRLTPPVGGYFRRN